MCGIVGVVDRGRWQTRDQLAKTIELMRDQLAHRGPDSAGSWLSGQHGVGLGHRRLSILDLSPQGHQPMESACGRFVIAFNGEIYNFQELRVELEAQRAAPVWRGHSDTEVLLAAISHWGVVKSAQKCVGMFAFALWDNEQNVLNIVRDRLGEKPLYYGWQKGVFLFGSELKALRAHSAWEGEIDRDAVAMFMRHGYIPTPYSVYKKIRKLPPGTVATLELDSLNAGADLRIEPYWSMEAVVNSGTSALFEGPGEAVGELERVLREAVKQQMVADVPLGAFLSGGIDSSTVAALMQAQSGRPIKTFSIGFHEDAYDEARYAKQVARHLGTDHTELYVTANEAMAVIPKLPTMFDEPFADSSQIPTYLVSALARQHVTVSLSGDGGDELFGGYNRYFWAERLWRNVGRLPIRVRSWIARQLTLVSPAQWQAAFSKLGGLLPASWRYRNPGDKLHKIAELLGAESRESIYLQLVSHWKQPASIVLGATEPLTVLTDRSQWPDLSTFVEQMMYLDTKSYLPDDILVKVDRAAMAVSLESRIPFLDHRVVEFAWRVPLSMKVRDGQGKWLLKELLYKYVPKHLVERPKMGFGVPIDSWLRGPLKDWAADLLSEQRLRRDGILEPEPIRKMWDEHLSGRRNWQYYLWDILMFQSWSDNNQVTRHSI